MREDGRSERKTNLPLCGCITPLEGEKPGMTKIIGHLQNITYLLVKDLKNSTNFKDGMKSQKYSPLAREHSESGLPIQVYKTSSR
jgi:hypothetical protein